MVYDISLGEKEIFSLKPWLYSIQLKCPSPVILVVGTHLDKLNIPQQEVQKLRILMRTKIKELLRQPGLSSNIAFAEVDCFNPKDTSDLRSKLKKLIDR